MAFFHGLAGAVGMGIAAALVGVGPYEVIGGAIVGFIIGALNWRFYLKPRLGHLDSFKKRQ